MANQLIGLSCSTVLPRASSFHLVRRQYQATAPNHLANGTVTHRGDGRTKPVELAGGHRLWQTRSDRNRHRTVQGADRIALAGSFVRCSADRGGYRSRRSQPYAGVWTPGVCSASSQPWIAIHLKDQAAFDLISAPSRAVTRTPRYPWHSIGHSPQGYHHQSKRRTHFMVSSSESKGCGASISGRWCSSKRMGFSARATVL